MKANRNNTLQLRTHSIRTLTPSELRVANGGSILGGCGALSKTTPTGATTERQHNFAPSARQQFAGR